MRIPHVINDNTRKTYSISNVYLRKELCKVDDFTWDYAFIPTLREMSLRCIAKHWEQNPLYHKLTLQADKLYLLELLATDLPLEMTVPVIDNDYYWERCYKETWPNSSPPNQRIRIDIAINLCSHIISSTCYDSDFTSYSYIDSDFTEFSRFSSDFVKFISDSYQTYISSETELKVTNFPNSESLQTSQEQVEQKLIVQDQSVNTEDPASSGHSFNWSPTSKHSFSYFLLKSWKQCFLERHMEEQLEQMKPDTFNVENIKELTSICGHYIISLNLKQLRPCKKEESNDHICLNTLLSNLPNLYELSVCYRQGNLEDNFNWHSLKVSESDCELLGRGLENSHLKILRLIRSDIDCRKVKILVRHLCNHSYLRILDLSHCKIGNDGGVVIAGMLANNFALERLILSNNLIGDKGAQAIGYYLCQTTSRLVELDLSLNPLQTEGGKYMATAVARGGETLKVLNLSSCQLTEENMHFGWALKLNKMLQRLILNNNNFGTISGNYFREGMEHNSTLIYLDMRMCGLENEDLEKIQSLVKKNLRTYRKVLKTVPSAENII